MRRLLVLTLLLCLLPYAALADLAVHFLSVGHGDCAILVCDGDAMVIDGGNAGSSQLLYAYLAELGVTRLSCVVATHPDGDHIGGLPAALHAAQVDVVYTPVLAHDGARFQTLMRTAQEKGVPVQQLRKGDGFSLGGAAVTVLSPQEPEGSDENDWSLVLLVTYGERSFLFMADAGVRIEEQLVEEGAPLSADVLKVAHHGSDSATLMQFALAVAPEYAVISGSDRYDNPSAETLTRLLVSGAHLVHTHQNGHIVITTDGESLEVTAQQYFIANINTMRYHRPGCSHAGRMKEAHRRLMFLSEEAAYKRFEPCHYCRPE